MAVVVYHHEFARDAGSFDEAIQDEIAAYVHLLMEVGPALGRPYADTLKGTSQFSKLKELRLTVQGVEWRVAYAFDTEQVGILLAGGSKNGINQDRFYATLITTAERRLAAHERGLAARSKAQAAAAGRKGAGKKRENR